MAIAEDPKKWLDWDKYCECHERFCVRATEQESHLEEHVHEYDHDRDEYEIPDIGKPSVKVLNHQEDCSNDSHDHPEDVCCPTGFDIGIGGVSKQYRSCYQSNTIQNCCINHH